MFLFVTLCFTAYELLLPGFELDKSCETFMFLFFLIEASQVSNLYPQLRIYVILDVVFYHFYGSVDVPILMLTLINGKSLLLGRYYFPT